MVRNGYTRMIALTGLTSGVPPAEVAVLVSIVYGISVLFFWLSESAAAGFQGRTRVGLVAFTLLGAASSRRPRRASAMEGARNRA